MWKNGWRDEIWAEMQTEWDIIVVGGGITGAGILNAAARAGLRVLLVEAGDFSSGTSSRSSKLVHGGFRYLRNRQFNVTYESVQERERLMREGPHLVTSLKFLLPNLGYSKKTAGELSLGVMIYDLMAPKWAHGHLSKSDYAAICPQLTTPALEDGNYYYDAEVDDTRLVLRVIQEGVKAGGRAINYCRVENLLKQANGRVCGVQIRDIADPKRERTGEVKARVVINATGPWTDQLRSQVGAEPRIRKLRGSHLFFPHERLPISVAITMYHPRDHRALFVFPWEGVTLIGTTDLDHPRELEISHPEPVITPAEVDYLMEAVNFLFPEAGLTSADIQSTIAGLRPIITGGAADPSKESRAYAVWQEDGLLTITGGKLTEYRRMAYETLEKARPLLKAGVHFHPNQPLFMNLAAEQNVELPAAVLNRLKGRYGVDALEIAADCPLTELSEMENLPAIWAEIRWGARAEGVIHLDDLLLRRTRLGLTAPRGGLDWMDRIRKIAQPELGWDDAIWTREEKRYAQLWEECYYVPRTDE